MNPETIRSQRFLLVRRGYDPDAVVAFLDEVADVLEAARTQDGDPSVAALELADVDRLVDEARTRASTQRLRAQRDIEALQRTARARRARLVAEIEELAVARDQLAQDLDRAAEVVDRVVSWVRRTDPAAPASAVAAPAEALDGSDAATAHAVPAEEPAGEPAGEHADEPLVDPHEGPDDEPAERLDEGQVGDARADAPVVDADESDADELDEGDVDDRHPDGATVDTDVTDTEGGADVEDVADSPGEQDVLVALGAVQDDVLDRLRDQPHGTVEDWVPSTTTLLALDDAVTPAAGRAFLDGWHAAGDVGAFDDVDAADQDEPDVGGAVARDALEDVRGAGSLPGLDLADDLRVAVRASLQRGVAADDTTAQLVERVTEVHRDVRQTMLPEALGHVLGAAHHHGLVARWRHDGIAAVAWVLGEERRCPGRRCRANASDGVVAPGDAFAFGELVPPAHAGCTCTLRPATPGEAADPR